MLLCVGRDEQTQHLSSCNSSPGKVVRFPLVQSSEDSELRNVFQACEAKNGEDSQVRRSEEEQLMKMAGNVPRQG